MEKQKIMDWLLDGDVSIQYQTYRDLLDEDRNDLQLKIASEGWGKKYLDKRQKNGHWGRGFYQPKWTSSHYTLLDLRNLCIQKKCSPLQKSIDIILSNEKGHDGGINPSGTINNSDVCINGMALNYCSYFQADEQKLRSIVDFILSQQMEDGGFNCQKNRKGARHSSLHSTLSVIEGIIEYKKNGYTYHLIELEKAADDSRNFILEHQMFKSDKTGIIIDKKMLSLSWPSRWRYDILRALDYFRYAGVHFDERMSAAINILSKKKKKDDTWNVQAKHPGEVHFDMETPGKSSRWNTLRALRVLKHFNLLN